MGWKHLLDYKKTHQFVLCAGDIDGDWFYAHQGVQTDPIDPVDPVDERVC